MQVYGSSAWSADYLDEALGPGRCRVGVHRQVAIGPVEDQYFVRPADAAMLVSYLRMLGPRRVVRKVVSRRRESTRNDAWVSVGLGRLPDGEPVGFVVPTGPRAVDRVVLDEGLVFPVAADVLDSVAAGHVAAGQGSTLWSELDADVAAALRALAGWRPAQERPISLADDVRSAVVDLLVAPPPAAATALPPPGRPGPVRERVDGPAGAAGFHLFGYGQYAKTQVIPNLGRRVPLACVHEIDPLQIGPVTEATHAWDTSGRPRADEDIRVAVLAGYHHTHAPLAVELLDRGAAHLVVEKPIASSVEQLDALLGAMARTPTGRVHVAFQRRHSPFNRLLREDLGDGPISMTASVYEVPLPARHWYRWPVVGNAVVSNGCHWIDHFLFLNGYVEVRALGATRLANQLVLTIELVTGATAAISLRHEGAPRRGVRDLCVFWNGSASAVIEDQRTYRSERGFEKLRTRTTHPYRSLEAMYAEFGRRIELDLPGDSAASTEVSAAVTLELARLADVAT